MTGTRTRFGKIAMAGAASNLAILVLVSVPVAAQTVPAQPSPATTAVQQPQDFADEVEIRIAELHNALRITPDQEALFRAYANTMRANAQATHAMFLARAQATDFTAPARLRWYAQAAAARADAINKLIAPFDALYQALSADQKAAADQYFEQFRLRRMPMHMRMHTHMQQ
ncbi:MAG TPA: Spy/CpxP family protein refolding chaperone [Stellaceae bacterium]|nr:Spy/CpxP family protein refolding chaperone [Stellaceae bacterium]